MASHLPQPAWFFTLCLRSVAFLAFLWNPCVGSQSDPLSELNKSLEEVVRKVAPAVVRIDITAPAERDAEDQDGAKARSQARPEHAIGSGVILDSTGYIVTNAHVVKGATKIRVILDKSVRTKYSPAGTLTLPARLIGEFEEADLALIKIDVQGLPTMPLNKQPGPRQGQIVIAIGSPEGLQNTVSMGVVGSVARQVTPDGHLSYIQMDAAINPGSSGGPLVDIKGNLIGINSFFLTEGGGSEGLGFAIPTRFVQFAYENILQNGKVMWGEAGVRVQGITRQLAEALHLSRESGVLVSDVVPGTSAERAGVKTRDVVIALDRKPVEDVAEYFETMYHKRAGDKVDLSVVRDRQVLNIELPITADSDGAQSTNEPSSPRIDLVPKLGVLCSELSSRPQLEVAHLRSQTGVVVEAKAIGGKSRTELSAGDVIRSVNLIPVSSVTELQSLLDKMKPDIPIVLQVEHKAQFTYVSVDPDW